MAGKRRPTSDLNHENWDREESPEKAGTFQKAADDVIKARVIKTAKRRNPISSVRSEDNKNSVFQTFTGFSKTPVPTSNAFSFLSNLSKSEQSKTNGIPEKKDSIASSSATTSAITTGTNKKQDKDIPNKKQKSPDVNKSEQTHTKSEEYYAKIKGLNESVSKWIKQHVDENPFVSLQPIFKDYEQYFEQIEKEDKNRQKNELTTTSQGKSNLENKGDVSSSSGFASFAFKPLEKATPGKTVEKTKPSWSFGVSSTTESKEASKLGGLAKKPCTVTETSKFTLGSVNSSTSNTTEAETPKFTFGSTKLNTDSSSVKKPEAETPKFSFGTTTSHTSPLLNKAEAEAPKFSFGTSNLNPAVSSEKKTESEAPKFSFGTSKSNTALSPEKKPDSDAPKFSFGTSNSNAASSSEKKTEAEAPKFSFGATTTTSNSFQMGAPQFSFGALASSTSTSGFSFPKPSGSVPGFSFTNVSKPESTEDKQNQEEDEEPPKNEFVPVIEEGHVYMTKCKVFVKKDKVFGDRGVGNLYLKPVPDSEKTQLIVRADTNLGNLLCNFILSENIPVQRMGKKDVMLVCLPMPDFKPPPTPILLRVKTPEEADTLLETLQKYKK